MKPKLLLRIAAILMLLHAVGHTMGTLNWQNNPDPAVSKVVQGMINQHFVFMGRSSTIAMFYTGYCVTLIFVLLLITALLWVAGDHTDNRPLINKLLALLFSFLCLFAVTEFIYFFLFAASFSFLAAVLTGMAMIRIRKTNSPN
jgi:hypothetical protein